VVRWLVSAAQTPSPGLGRFYAVAEPAGMCCIVEAVRGPGGIAVRLELDGDWREEARPGLVRTKLQVGPFGHRNAGHPRLELPAECGGDLFFFLPICPEQKKTPEKRCSAARVKRRDARCRATLIRQQGPLLKTPTAEP